METVKEKESVIKHFTKVCCPGDDITLKFKIPSDKFCYLELVVREIPVFDEPKL